MKGVSQSSNFYFNLLAKHLPIPATADGGLSLYCKPQERPYSLFCTVCLQVKFRGAPFNEDEELTAGSDEKKNRAQPHGCQFFHLCRRNEKRENWNRNDPDKSELSIVRLHFDCSCF